MEWMPSLRVLVVNPGSSSLKLSVLGEGVILANRLEGVDAQRCYGRGWRFFSCAFHSRRKVAARAASFPVRH